MAEIALAVLAGPVLWFPGALLFDAVHWGLHLMLRSRSPWLRALARPHGVHHEWIDRELVTHWELQRANVFCHIVPEYGTQLLYTAGVAWLLPLPFAIVLFGLQTAIFLGILSAGGRDINHRPAERVDAHPAGWLTPPSYHVLHHVFPDAHFSAYTKVVDWIVGGGAAIAGRRFAWRGPESRLGAALRDEVELAGGIDAGSEASTDVLVLLDPDAPLAAPVEALIDATRERQLPPEVWALRRSDDPVARHYRDDVRVSLRTLLVPEEELDAPHAHRAARRGLFWIRRDAHFAALAQPLGLAARRRFRRTPALAPPGAALVRHRLEFAAAGPAN